MSHDEALRAAVDLYLMPSRVRQQRSAPIPNGIDALLLVAAGDEPTMRQMASILERSPGFLQRAARFFVEEVLLDQGSDSYRVFGLSSEASQEELRRHMGLLAKWIHPDQGSHILGYHYATRLSSAWNDVKSQERRTLYEDQRRALPSPRSSSDDQSAGSAQNEGLTWSPERATEGRNGLKVRRLGVKSRLVAFIRNIAYGP